MGKFACLVGALMVVSTLVMAEEIDLKQGFLMTWEDQSFKNLTVVKVAETTPVEGWGKWNALWVGWTLEAGWAYAASDLTSVALMVGRKLGTVQDYLPIKVPLTDKFEITAYPIGMYATSIFDHPQFQGASGGALVKLAIKY